MRITTIVLFIFPCIVYAQGLIVSVDSSEVLFPNHVKISFNKSKVNGRTYFQMDRKAFKAFILTTNNYLEQNSIAADNVELLLKNQNLLDSSFQLLERKLTIEKDRTILYQRANEDLKQVSSTYNQQLLKCTDDLRDLKKEKGRPKARSFITGIFVGSGLAMLIYASVSGGN